MTFTRKGRVDGGVQERKKKGRKASWPGYLGPGGYLGRVPHLKHNPDPMSPAGATAPLGGLTLAQVKKTAKS